MFKMVVYLGVRSQDLNRSLLTFAILATAKISDGMYAKTLATGIQTHSGKCGCSRVSSSLTASVLTRNALTQLERQNEQLSRRLKKAVFASTYARRVANNSEWFQISMTCQTAKLPIISVGITFAPCN